jgi:hypothetical protein
MESFLRRDKFLIIAGIFQVERVCRLITAHLPDQWRKVRSVPRNFRQEFFWLISIVRSSYMLWIHDCKI